MPALLKDFHLGMVNRLAEVLRRRETLMGTTVTPRAPTTALPKPAAIGPAARQLTVAELQVAERQPAGPVQPALTAPRNQVAREKRKAVLERPKWIKEHNIVPLELRVALGFCSVIPPGWKLIGVFLIIFFACPRWKEVSSFMRRLGGC